MSLQVDLRWLKLRSASHPLLSSVSFELDRRGIVALVGASGVGKSSLLAWLAGCLSPAMQASGSIHFDGEQLQRYGAERRRIGFMTQQHTLFPHMSAGQNILFGLRSAGELQDRRQQVEHAMQRVGLGDLYDREPDSLSGGQRARVCLLRTLLSRPRVVLLDEPFVGIDEHQRQSLGAWMWDQIGDLPVVLCTHDLRDVPARADPLPLGN